MTSSVIDHDGVTTQDLTASKGWTAVHLIAPGLGVAAVAAVVASEHPALYVFSVFIPALTVIGAYAAASRGARRAGAELNGGKYVVIVLGLAVLVLLSLRASWALGPAELTAAAFVVLGVAWRDALVAAASAAGFLAVMPVDIMGPLTVAGIDDSTRAATLLVVAGVLSGLGLGVALRRGSSPPNKISVR